MTTIWKIIFTAIILIAIVGGIVWYNINSQLTVDQGAQNSLAATATVPTSSAPVSSTGSNAPALSKGSSDASIAQDTATIDTQINAIGSDSASADQGLNDKPVSQSY